MRITNKPCEQIRQSIIINHKLVLSARYFEVTVKATYFEARTKSIARVLLAVGVRHFGDIMKQVARCAKRVQIGHMSRFVIHNHQPQINVISQLVCSNTKKY